MTLPREKPLPAITPLHQIRLNSLMAVSQGHPDIPIGLIDGPVSLQHPAFQKTDVPLTSLSASGTCRVPDSQACFHGTFVAGMLSARRDTPAPAICPACPLLIRPVFTETSGTTPATTETELADALMEVINAGAKIINLSLGLSRSALTTSSPLEAAYGYARQKRVLVVIASGNQGRIGFNSLFHHSWVIPVIACDSLGRVSGESNLGFSVARRGLMAPGYQVTSVSAGGGYSQMSGTSVAAPFVTGTLALLWSRFPCAAPADLLRAITRA